jgi:nitrogen fixation/metabolism regulation signal transduction histidine kinase
VIILFAGIFFSEILQGSYIPEILDLVIFFTIPGVLLVFLVVSVVNLVRDLIATRPGSRFQIRLLGYFTLIVIFTSVPLTILTIQALIKVVSFWKTIDVNTAMNHAQEFAVDVYSLRLEKLETLVRETDFDVLMAAQGREGGAGTADLPEVVIGIQDFTLQEDGTWVSVGFLGTADQQFTTPPSFQQGFVSREMPRDTDIIRYIRYPAERVLRLISCSLGVDFDAVRTTMEMSRERLETINSLRINLRFLVLFYYGVFFLPAFLMTIIIAISFTGQVTQPIVALTDATQRVAEGDFSIRIMARHGDELGRLIRSFDMMVRNLEQSQASLVKAEKISIWQSMAQQLAHEIKNPLTPIKLSAERVLRRWRNQPEQVGEILESSMLAIIQETEGLATLLTEFRTLSRPTEPSQSRTLLWELAEELITLYRTSYPEVQFNLEHIKAGVLIKVDRHRLSQILTNLIINGIDAMNGKGSMEIRTDLVKKWENHYCRLSIQDSGKGMTKEEGSRIFTPYFTTKESGTGLGLPIVERIVHDHGGTIWFNSAEGMGTTFFIDLPIELPSEALAPQVVSPAEPIPSGGGNQEA